MAVQIQDLQSAAVHACAEIMAPTQLVTGLEGVDFTLRPFFFEDRYNLVPS